MSYLPQRNINLLIMNILKRMCIYLTGEFPYWKCGIFQTCILQWTVMYNYLQHLKMKVIFNCLLRRGQMERFILVWSDWNILYHLWRWSTLIYWTKICSSILINWFIALPLLFTKWWVRERNGKWEDSFLLVGPV